MPVIDTKNLFQVMLNEGFQAGHVNLFPDPKTVTPQNPSQKPEEPKALLIDDMSPSMLMDLIKQIIQQRSDPA
jgi:hypothetical protein